MAIGDKILDLSVVKHLFTGSVMTANQDVFDEVSRRADISSFLKSLFTPKGKQMSIAFFQPVLNKFMALGHNAWKETRARLQELLSVNNSEIKGNIELMNK